MPNTGQLYHLESSGEKNPKASTTGDHVVAISCHHSGISPLLPARLPPRFGKPHHCWVLQALLPFGVVQCTSMSVFTQTYEGALFKSMFYFLGQSYVHSKIESYRDFPFPPTPTHAQPPPLSASPTRVVPLLQLMN